MGVGSRAGGGVGRRDHLAFDACGLELALQREAARASPGAMRSRRCASRFTERGSCASCHSSDRPPSALRRQYPHLDRRGVCIHPYICGSHLLDRLPFVCGSVASRRNLRAGELGAGHSIGFSASSSDEVHCSASGLPT